MDTSKDVYDVIVVGAGIEGSSTAYQLAKQGKRTLLIEQFPLPHSRGSSHGQSRITRKAYGEQDYYTKMMFESFKLLEELEQECGEQLFVNCGCLVISPKNNKFAKNTESCLKRYGVPHETFGVAKQRVKYPQMRFDEGYEFVLDTSGGMLRAAKILDAFQSQFKKYGGTLKDGEPMLDLFPDKIVTVKTTKGVYRAKSVVLALGPWAAKFLPSIGVNIPLQPLKITVCYWKEKIRSSYDTSKFPCFLTDLSVGSSGVYGMPVEEYPGLVKICLHNGPRIDPDNRDGVENQWVLNQIKDVIAKHFPTLEKEPSIVETCIYTNTPDGDFVLDKHPTWDNVVIAAGFSGHGFKLAPVVGKVVSQLATGQTPDYDMTQFKINRFFKNKL